MHPFEVTKNLEMGGFWFTYWNLRNTFEYSRWQSLWLIWVGWNYSRHRDELYKSTD